MNGRRDTAVIGLDMDGTTRRTCAGQFHGRDVCDRDARRALPLSLFHARAGHLPDVPRGAWAITSLLAA